LDVQLITELALPSKISNSYSFRVKVEKVMEKGYAGSGPKHILGLLQSPTKVLVKMSAGEG
jgi:hypothetical protein